MSKAGAPKGNSNAVKGKRWLNAIEKALNERQSKSEQQDALVELAHKLLDECASGNLSALQELGSRLDGKPTQQITGDIVHEHTHYHEGLQDADSRIDDILRRGEATSNPTSKPH